MSVITLGGMSGGGARDIGPLLAKKLNADYVDRIFLATVAKKIGATVEALQVREERLPSRSEKWLNFVQKILERSAVTGASGDPYFGSGSSAFLTDEFDDIATPIITEPHTIEDDHYIDAIHEIMRDMAETGDVVFVGRGGHLILNDMPNVLRVGIVAHTEDRISSLTKRESISEEKAVALIASRDEARKEYFRKFFNIDDPDKSDLFHLTINTSEVNLDYSVDMIINALSALREGKIKGDASIIDG